MIRDLYRGDLCPSDKERSVEYKKKLDKAYSLNCNFQKHLKKKGNEAYAKVLDAFLELLVLAMEEGYISGFKDGSKLVIEIIEK